MSSLVSKEEIFSLREKYLVPMISSGKQYFVIHNDGSLMDFAEELLSIAESHLNEKSVKPTKTSKKK